MENIKYALENGFSLKFKLLNDQSVQVSWGTLEHVEILTLEEAAELNLIEIKEEDVMKEWSESKDTTFVATAKSSEKIKTSKGRKAKSTNSETVVNDLALLNGLSSEFKVGAVMRLQHFLRNAKLGKVVDYDLSLGNKGDIVGRVMGTDGTATLRQYVYLTPNGNEAWRMKVIQGN